MSIARAVLDVLMPAVCPLCGHAPCSQLCAECTALIEALRAEHPCPRCCASRRNASDTCATCAGRGLPHIAQAHATFQYRGAVQRLVAAAKTMGRPAAVRTCAELISVPESWATMQAVIPIPPSPGRRAGPHLASALAARVARQMRLPLLRCLRLARSAAAQHDLHEEQRFENVRDLFLVRGAVAHQVLIVDDLLTSGATLSSAARALREAGATAVHALVLARTPAQRAD